MESDELNYAMNHLLRMAEPNTALIITQNEEGEIIDARIMNVTEALFLLRYAQRGEREEEKPKESDSLWWHP